jgi:hypothetical protein
MADIENQEMSENLEEQKELNFLEDLDLDEYFELLNIFQIYYNQKYNSQNGEKENMLEHIDLSDPTSTNKSLEIFYSSIHEYKINRNIGEEYITVFKPEEFNRIFDVRKEEENKNIYMLYLKEQEYLSFSFLALILYIQLNSNYYEEVWKIIKLNIEE